MATISTSSSRAEAGASQSRLWVSGEVTFQALTSEAFLTQIQTCHLNSELFSNGTEKCLVLKASKELVCQAS